MDSVERERRILSLAPNVHYHALKLWRRVPRGIEESELLGAAWLGAIHAVDRWQPGRGAALCTFAERHIRGSMSDYLRSIDPLTRNGRIRYKASVLRARAAGEPDPPPPFISVPIEKIVSISDRRGPADMRRLEAREDLARIIARSNLDERERGIVERHELGGEGLREIGRSFGVGEARASQIKRRAIEKLRKAA